MPQKPIDLTQLSAEEVAQRIGFLVLELSETGGGVVLLRSPSQSLVALPLSVVSGDQVVEELIARDWDSKEIMSLLEDIDLLWKT